MRQDLEQLRKAFPYMLDEFDKGNVLVWNNMGYPSELQPKHKSHIAELEEKYSKYMLKVYAVLDNHMYLEGSDTVHMTSYLFISNEDVDISKCTDDIYYAIADVINETWDITEMGSVIIQSCPTGGPRRVG